MALSAVALLRDLKGEVEQARALAQVASADKQTTTYRQGIIYECEGLIKACEASLENADKADERELLGSARRMHYTLATDVSWWLSALTHFCEEDRTLTKLLSRLAEEARWPCDPPFVSCTMSTGSFITEARAGLVVVAAGEHDRLLAVPDAVHEMAHELFRVDHVEVLGDFYAEQVDPYLTAIATDDEERAVLDTAFSAWLEEFFCDMVATYVCGPSYGWQHHRLCARMDTDEYAPYLDERLDPEGPHPPDHARMRAIAFMLEEIGWTQEAAAQRDRFARLQAMTGNVKPPDRYERVLPDDLLRAMAAQIAGACNDEKAMPSFTYPSETGETVCAAVHDAWLVAISDIASYRAYEAGRVTALTVGIGS